MLALALELSICWALNTSEAFKESEFNYINSILKWAFVSNSLAMPQLGFLKPFRTHTICRTRSTYRRLSYFFLTYHRIRFRVLLELNEVCFCDLPQTLLDLSLAVLQVLMTQVLLVTVNDEFFSFILYFFRVVQVLVCVV